jgi:hypothetical protein
VIATGVMRGVREGVEVRSAYHAVHVTPTHRSEGQLGPLYATVESRKNAEVS